MFTIFHISDPHFATKIIHDGSSSSVSEKVRESLDGLRGHSGDVWMVFLKSIKPKIARLDDYRIIVTGDVSQIGEQGSFELASNLFFQGSSAISIDHGLQVASEKFFIVPGNHDTYDAKMFAKNNLRLFNASFRPDGKYPFVECAMIDGQRVYFIGLNSTYSMRTCSIPRKLGRGRIDSKQYDMISGFLEGVDDGIKIVCLHHCPIFPNDCRDWSLVLENSARFIDWCVENKIDIILCGHIHDDFYDALPLRRLVKFLPKKRGLKSFMRRMLRQTILSDYTPIIIHGKHARYIDSIAYRYISENVNDIKRLDEFRNVNDFTKYIQARIEYNEFLSDFDVMKKNKTALIMAGSVCQNNKQNNNSYFELECDFDNRIINLTKYKYNKDNNEFQARHSRVINF